MISWPWNLGYRSLKIIQTGTIRKVGCGFLFAFHSNYGSILHHLRDKARYWSKIVIFHTPCIRRPRYGGPQWNIAIPFGVENLELWGYPTVKKFEDMYNRLDTGVWQTDRKTFCDGIVRAMHTRRAVKTWLILFSSMYILTIKSL